MQDPHLGQKWDPTPGRGSRNPGLRDYFGAIIRDYLESQDYGMIWVKRDLKDHQIPTPRDTGGDLHPTGSAGAFTTPLPRPNSWDTSRSEHMEGREKGSLWWCGTAPAPHGQLGTCGEAQMEIVGDSGAGESMGSVNPGILR